MPARNAPFGMLRHPSSILDGNWLSALYAPEERLLVFPLYTAGKLIDETCVLVTGPARYKPLSLVGFVITFTYTEIRDGGSPQIDLFTYLRILETVFSHSHHRLVK